MRPRAVLDFGCGTGSAAPFFLELLGVERVLGVDVSERSLEVARREHGSERARFVALRDFQPDASFPLAFCNGVFHHVRPEERSGVVGPAPEKPRSRGPLRAVGQQPLEPRGTLRHVAHPLRPRRGDAVVAGSGAACWPGVASRSLRTDYLFVFPRLLKALRGLEPVLARAPLGAQYQVLACRPEA